MFQCESPESVALVNRVMETGSEIEKIERDSRKDTELGEARTDRKVNPKHRNQEKI